MFCEQFFLLSAELYLSVALHHVKPNYSKNLQILNMHLNHVKSSVLIWPACKLGIFGASIGSNCKAKQYVVKAEYIWMKIDRNPLQIWSVTCRIVEEICLCSVSVTVPAIIDKSLKKKKFVFQVPCSLHAGLYLIVWSIHRYSLFIGGMSNKS